MNGKDFELDFELTVKVEEDISSSEWFKVYEKLKKFKCKLNLEVKSLDRYQPRSFVPQIDYPSLFASNKLWNCKFPSIIEEMFPYQNLQELNHLILWFPTFDSQPVDFKWPKKATYYLNEYDINKYVEYNKAEEVQWILGYNSNDKLPINICQFQFHFIQLYLYRNNLNEKETEDLMMNLKCTNIKFGFDSLSDKLRQSVYRGLNKRKSSPMNIFVDDCYLQIFKEFFNYLNQDVLSHVTVRIRDHRCKWQDFVDFVLSQNKKMKRIYVVDLTLHRIPQNEYKDMMKKLSTKTHLFATPFEADLSEEKLFEMKSI